MTRRRILVYPDSRLRNKAVAVNDFTEATQRLAEDMLETMYDAPGIGLAGPQIGVMRRIIVMDCSPKTEERQPVALVNPEIVWTSEESEKHEEGCLSLPNQFADVTRPIFVRVEFQNVSGDRREETFEDLWARCVQHEIDHLNGVLFIDHLSSLKRRMIHRRMEKERLRSTQA